MPWIIDYDYELLININPGDAWWRGGRLPPLLYYVPPVNETKTIIFDLWGFFSSLESVNVILLKINTFNMVGNLMTIHLMVILYEHSNSKGHYIPFSAKYRFI